MKKHLLLFIMCVCASIGAWAAMPPIEGTGYTLHDKTDHWQQNVGKVVKIEISETGGLSNALAELQTIISTGQPADVAAQLQGYTMLHIASKPKNASITLNNADIAALNHATVTAETIDLQDLKTSAQTSEGAVITISNTSVKYLILPDGWTKSEVSTAVQPLLTSANFDAALSMEKITNESSSLIAYLKTPGTLRDALLHSGYEGPDHSNKKLGTGTGQCANLKTLIAMGNICAKDISRMGVYDANGHYVINGVADENRVEYAMNTNGERLYPGSQSEVNHPDAVDGALVGCFAPEVIDLSDAIFDPNHFEDATIAYNGMNSTNLREVWIPTDASFTTIPPDFLNTSSNYLHEICIPGNIKYIRTRAFGSTGCRINYIWTTGTDPNTRYDNGAYFVSNGEATQQYHDDEDFDHNNFNYGTITLPANLLLIERFAFGGCNHVKDVYSLALTAPQCHVDAFSTVLYVANNTYDPGLITDGIITRDAYSMSNYEMMAVLHYPRETQTPNTQRYTDPTREYSVATGDRDGYGNTIYYPNQSEFCQAYLQGSYGYVWKAWDDSRNWYNNEITMASETGNLHMDMISHYNNGASGYQEIANNWYEINTYAGKTDRSFYDVTMSDNNQPGEVGYPAGLDPYYEYFYKEYLYPQAETNATGYFKYMEATQEDIDNGITIYTKNGNDYVEHSDGAVDPGTTYYRRIQNQVVENGELQFSSCSNGHYVEDYRYINDPEGDFVKTLLSTSYESTSTSIKGVTTYYSDNEGNNEATPKVAYGFWYENGVDPNWLGTQSPVTGVTTYYSSQNLNSEVTPTLSQSYYYPTGGVAYEYGQTQTPVAGVTTYFTDNQGGGRTQTPQLATWANWYYVSGTAAFSTSTFKPGIYTYYSDEECTTEATPEINYYGSKLYYNNNGTWVQTDVVIDGVDNYYLENQWGNPVQSNQISLDDTYYYQGDNYVSTTTLQPGVTTYYVSHNPGVYQEQAPQFSDTYYYVTKIIDEYLQINTWNPEQDYYTQNNNNGNVTYTKFTGPFYFNQNYYYFKTSSPHYDSAQNLDFNPETTYYSDNTGSTVATTVTFDQSYFYPVYSYSYTAYDENNPIEGDRVRREAYKREKVDGDTGPFYCPVMEDVAFYGIEDYNDYRGWHQFVLTAYAHNSKEEFEPLKSFITDNDWWTICEPYDLRYSDMIKFFGTEGDNPKLPYLSKLMYVIRDVKKQKITLMFSKNLMVYKEQFEGEGLNVETVEVSGEPVDLRSQSVEVDGTTLSLGGRVHGVVDDVTLWTAEEIAADPIILHAGVPYLIKPQMTEDATTKKFQRQFDIYKSQKEDLYNRLKASQKLTGSVQMQLVYNGEYTVPAYVVNNDDPDAPFTEPVESSGEKSFIMKDGTKITYYDSDHGGAPLTYGGQTNVPYQISSKFTYTFVGSFYKSVMPQYCYFLGWDSSKNRAAFWYSAVQDKSGWNWNNETGIICPNFNTNLRIDPATGLNDPARWIFAGASAVNDQTNIKCDDFVPGNTYGGQNNGAKSYGMDMGATNFFEMEEDGVATSIEEMPTEAPATISIYTTEGVYVGSKVQGLKKGIYVINGKKYVVK